MIIPFLQLLFDQTQLIHEAPAFAFNTDSILAYFNYIISGIILSKGPVEALLFISVIVVVMFFL